jgi:hypothetical protein
MMPQLSEKSGQCGLCQKAIAVPLPVSARAWPKSLAGSCGRVEPLVRFHEYTELTARHRHGPEHSGLCACTGANAPTAIVTGNRSIALPKTKALKEIGPTWHQGVAIGTFDDPEWATFLDSPLGTVRGPTRELAKEALALLESQIDGIAFDPRVVSIHAEVIERNSSTGVPRHGRPQ